MTRRCPAVSIVMPFRDARETLPECLESIAGQSFGDYELWLRLHHQGYRMAKLARVLLDWRDGPTRASRTDPRYSRAAFDRLRARFLARDPRLQAHPLVIWGAGRNTRKRVRWLLTHGFKPRAWIDIDPRKIGNRLEGSRSSPPNGSANAPSPSC